MSYQNLIMYGSVLPSYNSKDDKGDKKGKKVINADDPANKEQIRKILYG